MVRNQNTALVGIKGKETGFKWLHSEAYYEGHPSERKHT
jgi:hypothetical protein